MKNGLVNKVGANRALVLLGLGLSALAVYIISCVHSPVSWSPDSSKIALSVMADNNELEVMAIFTYDIETGKRVLISAPGDGSILSGPAWSPDGKWIAYYKYVEPKKTEADTSDALDVPVPAEGAENVLGLFSEDNRVRPGFVFEAGSELLAEHDDVETSDIQLVVVGSDGKESKITRTFRWVADDDDVKGQLLYGQPRWSADSTRVFYLRLLDSVAYVGSLNIATGKTEAHAFTTSIFWAVSPDGRWLAAPLEGEVSLSRTDGSMSKYFRVSVGQEDEGDGENMYVDWASDSKRILLSIERGFVVMDLRTGKQRVYKDATSEGIRYQKFSPDGKKVYYLAAYQTEEENTSQKAIAIRAINLDSEAVETVTLLPEIVADNDEGVGTFSVSPNGQMFLVRGVLEDEAGGEFNALIFFDGRKRRVVRTDSWLREPVNETSR